jgi:hypothetical protein
MKPIVGHVLKNSLPHVVDEVHYRIYKSDRLCGIVVRVPGYRSKGPGSISGTTRLSEK